MSSAHVLRGQCQIYQFDSPNDNDDSYGNAVAVTDDEQTVVISDSTGIAFFGAAYVWKLQSGQWELEATLTPPEPELNDCFGCAMAIERDCIVVGAAEHDAIGVGSGAAFVYRRHERQWVYDGMLTALSTDADDSFGWAVAMDATQTVILIGAAHDESDGDESHGAAYVFRYNGAEWEEEQQLVDPNAQIDDVFGVAVSINNDVALIGASGDDGNALKAGAALVYRFDGATWIFEQELRAFDARILDSFGLSVALSGDATVAVVGAPRVDNQTGAAYVFRYDGQEWVFAQELVAEKPAGFFPNFGACVAMSDSSAAILIGAPGDFAQGFASGAAHLFRSQGEEWFEVAKLSSAGSGGLFGRSLAIAHELVLIGAVGDGFPGAAHLYTGALGSDCNGNSIPDACGIFDGIEDDLNENGVVDECENNGDLNGDGSVNVEDLVELILNWGSCPGPCPPACSGDLNSDCLVDVVDMLSLLGNWTT